MEIRIHCSYKYCKQNDFLPFNCQLCSQSFCVEHRTQDSHECQLQKVQKKAIVCPNCVKTFQFDSALTEDELISIHMADCTGPTAQTTIQTFAKIKRTCYVPKCYVDLKEINTHKCKTCQKDYCLKHRFPEVHNCQTQSSAQIPQQQRQEPRNIPGSYNFNNPYNQKYLENQWK